MMLSRSCLHAAWLTISLNTSSAYYVRIWKFCFTTELSRSSTLKIVTNEKFTIAVQCVELKFSAFCSRYIICAFIKLLAFFFPIIHSISVTCIFNLKTCKWQMANGVGDLKAEMSLCIPATKNASTHGTWSSRSTGMSYVKFSPSLALNKKRRPMQFCMASHQAKSPIHNNTIVQVIVLACFVMFIT
jgi:hypothetical protein